MTSDTCLYTASEVPQSSRVGGWLRPHVGPQRGVLPGRRLVLFWRRVLRGGRGRQALEQRRLQRLRGGAAGAALGRQQLLVVLQRQVALQLRLRAPTQAPPLQPLPCSHCQNCTATPQSLLEGAVKYIPGVTEKKHYMICANQTFDQARRIAFTSAHMATPFSAQK